MDLNSPPTLKDGGKSIRTCGGSCKGNGRRRDRRRRSASGVANGSVNSCGSDGGSGGNGYGIVEGGGSSSYTCSSVNRPIGEHGAIEKRCLYCLGTNCVV